MIKNKYHDFYEPDMRLLFVDQILNKGWDHDRLSAPFWRFYWNDEPGSYIIFEGRRIEITPGKIVLIPPNTPFISRVVKPTQHFYIHFVVKPPYNSITDKIFTFPINSDLLNTIKSCIGSSQNLYQKFKRYRLSVRRNNIAISTINSSAKSTEKKHDILPKYYVFENFNKRLKRQL